MDLNETAAELGLDQLARAKSVKVLAGTLGTAFAGFPDPVLLADAEGEILFMNPAAEQLFGRGRGVGFLPDASDGELRTFIGKCFDEGTLENHILHLKKNGGGEAALSVSASLVKDGEGNASVCLAVLKHLPASLPARPEIRNRLDMLEGILDRYPTPFCAVDRDFKIIYMNRRMEALAGRSRAEVLGRLTCAEVLACRRSPADEGCPLKQVMEGRTSAQDLRRTLVDAEGRRMTVEVHAAAIVDGDGRVIGGFKAFRDVTSSVEAEQKIEILTEISQEGILMIDEDERVIFANSKMGEILHRSRESLVGMNARELLPEQHMNMLAELLQGADRKQSRNVSFCTTFEPAGDASGARRAFETSMAVLRMSKGSIACTYFYEISKRIETERQLRDANSFLTNIIRSSVDGIVVIDPKGKVVIFNEGAERIMGYKAEEIIGDPRGFSKICDPKVAKENMRRMRSREHGLPGKLNTTRINLIDKNGQPVPLNFSAAIIKDGDREIGSVGIFSDLREHLKLRRELEEARLQLMQTEKIASLGRLAAGVAHEINNPLAGILIYADMLAKELSVNPQWREDLDEIINQTLRCKQIVTRLLEFSRQSLGERYSFDVNDITVRCIELLAHQALFHNIEFIRSLSPDLPQVVGDAGQLQQVFLNLIINAAAAMNGKGRIAIESRFDEVAQMVVVRFADSGPGIPSEIMDKIFEPFFTTKAPGEGTGLGLSVAYGIIQQHGGSIEVENVPEGGAVFTVKLPLESPEEFQTNG